MAQRFNPEMLAILRGSTGATQKEIAEVIDVAQGTFSKMEAGVLEPSSEKLVALSRHFSVLPAFFHRQDSLRNLAVSMHRSRSSLGQRERNKIESVFNFLKICIRHLNKTYGKTPAFELPDLGDVDAEEAADRVRAVSCLPPGPVPSIVNNLEGFGIIIVERDDLPEGVDALCCHPVDDVPPLIIMNSRVPPDRATFTLAHELGHLCLHRFPSENMENEANRFAAEFLMPREEIRGSLANTSIARLARLKPFWKVSMAALLKRAGDIDAITKEQARGLWMEMSVRGFRKAEPVLLAPITEPTLLRSMLQSHIDSSAGDLTVAADQLGLPLSRFIVEFGHLLNQTER